MQIKFIVLAFVSLESGLAVGLLWWLNLPLYYAVITPIVTLFLCYILAPFLFVYNSSVQRYFVFQATEKLPPNMNFGELANQKLVGCRHFYLSPCDDHKLGAWHVLPKSLITTEELTEEEKALEWENKLKYSGKDVVIYFHGNTGTRALEHRVELYRLLRDMDYHVIAFDYRGFGDSSHIQLSESTVIQDGQFIYNWVRGIVGEKSNSQIFIWGHSLGTGISSHVIRTICDDSSSTNPSGLILESPFTNIGEAMKHHRRAKLYKWWPFFDALFVSALYKNNIAFKTDTHIQNLPLRMLLLHAIDDETVPYFLGKKLVDHALFHHRPECSPSPYLKTFTCGGHKDIYKNETLEEIVRDFISNRNSNDL